MLRTLWTKTLREYRVAILGWGGGVAVLLWAQLVAYAGMSPAGQAAEAKLAQSYRFFGEPVAVNTAVGYTTWHMLGYLPVVLGIWAVLAGARLVRGEEERGSLELLLATPLARTRVLAEKSAAMVLALLLIGCLLATGLVVGEVAARMPVEVGRALLTGLNISLCTFVFGALAIFLSQLVGSRAAAAGWAGGVMVLSYFLDGTSRIVAHGAWLGHLTPLYYFNLSKPLIPSYGTSLGGITVLLGLGACFALSSLLLFAWRDIGGTAWPARRAVSTSPRPQSGAQVLERARHDVFVRTVGLRALRAQAVAVAWWLAGLCILAFYLTAIVPSFRDSFRQVVESNPVLDQLLGQYNFGTDNGLLAAMAFLYLPVLSVVFTLTIAMRWPHDLESGRLELVLGTPPRRLRIYLERLGAVCVAALLAPLAIGISLGLGAAMSGLHVDAGHLAAAVIGIVPLELISIAVVFLLVGWLRGPAVLGVSTMLVALSFFAEFLQAILKLPEWVIALSVFHQYGSPMVESPHWGAWLLICALAVALLALGAARFARGDVRAGG